MAFEVIPALDLRGGKCVRLYQGDFSQETVFSDNPVEMAQRWSDLGAPRLHVVDLDGAASGAPANLSVIRRIVAAVPCPVQVGGGIRSLETIELLRGHGVQRAILGTAAIRDAALVKEACRRFDEAVIVGIDARDGMVAIQGWREVTGARALDLAARMAELGVRRLIYTDIARDGTLTEPNFPALEQLLKSVPVAIVASGGVSKPEHLVRLRALGCEGAIVGRALYTGDLDLGAALASVAQA